jgi:hypothetical protein
MKQNIDLMNQFYKNVYALYEDSYRAKQLGQEYISIELMVEKEIIKRYIALPEDHVETFEKLVNSLYPGSVIEHTGQPKLLQAGKYMA